MRHNKSSSKFLLLPLCQALPIAPPYKSFRRIKGNISAVRRARSWSKTASASRLLSNPPQGCLSYSNFEDMSPQNPRKPAAKAVVIKCNNNKENRTSGIPQTAMAPLFLFLFHRHQPENNQIMVIASWSVNIIISKGLALRIQRWVHCFCSLQSIYILKWYYYDWRNS